MDIIADKLRGYLGLVDDLHERKDKVLAACESLLPHLLHVARSTADPARLVPVGYWMHRGGVPFVSPQIFKSIYWPTVKPIIEELWADGIQTLFYAEGKWDRHLESFAELPDRSIVYHVDQGDIARTHKILGEKFCLSGGVSNVILAHGTPDDVRRRCKEVIDIAARDGGYIMDSSAIMQNDAKVENVKAMTDFTREYGVYSTSCTARVRATRVRCHSQTFPQLQSRHQAARRGCPMGRETCADTGHHRRSRSDPESMGRDRRPGEYVYLADFAVVLDARGTGLGNPVPRERLSDFLELAENKVSGPRHVRPPKVLDNHGERAVELGQQAEKERVIQHAQARGRKVLGLG